MFKNLVTLVTGGAAGLGRATATRFVKKGGKVVICDLPQSQGESVAKELGENALFVPADVTSEKDVQHLISEVERVHGKLNVLVNCAGLSSAFETYNFSREKPRLLEDFQKVILTNLLGTYNVIRLSAGLIGRNELDEDGLKGVVINTSSIEAYNGTRGQVANATAAGGIQSLTKPLAADFSSAGIRVVAIAPGMMTTDLNGFLPKDTEEAISNECLIAPNRLGHPDEFAQVVQTIVANPYINVTTIEVAAGINLNM